MLNINICEKNNIIEESVLGAMSNGKKIYLYGCGEIGILLAQRFEKIGIRVDGFVVDNEYRNKGLMITGIPVLCIEDILDDITQDKIIVIAHRDYRKEKLQKYNVEVINEDIFYLNFVEDDDTCMDYEFVEMYRKQFQSFFHELQDDMSRRCMESFLNQKISGKLKYLKDLYEENQYYDKKFVDFNRIRCLVDCGAYNGDSYLSFLENYKNAVGKVYEGMAYLLEPDKNNYRVLKENCGNDIRCKIFEAGAWKERDILTFSEGGTSSVITQSGTISIFVNKIDNMVDTRVDFIKMDIEGAEYEALLGAKETIKKDHPILAICVYHKKRDLLDIPELIKSFCSQYQFYLRAYSKYSQELVLYAVYKP